MHNNIEIIRGEHDHLVCAIIKRVGSEFGAAGEGYGPSDLEVETMSQYYDDQCASRYFIAKLEGKIVGGGGIAAFDIDNGSMGSNQNICELRKLFLLPQGRGLGLGKKLAEACLHYAKSKGYTHCYLDTLSNMQAAIMLYEKLGFVHLEKPLQGTIHGGCDVWMLKAL